MPQPSPLSARAIDVHCHIFNGADLPIRGFVEDVVLSLPDDALSIAADALVDLVCAVIKGQAISASKEAALLRSGSHAHALSLPLVSPDDLFRSRVIPAIDSLRGAAAPAAGPRLDLTPLGPQQPAQREHLESAFEHFGSIGRSAHLRARANITEPQGSFSSSEIVDGILAEGGAVYGTLWLGCLLTLNRVELAQRLATLPSQDAADVRMFLPAMVDYSYWVQDFEVSSHADQIDVMSQIAKGQGNIPRVHAWVSYCPWRQIHDKDQLTRIQEAVMTGGLMGVKLYPPIGFYPTGNATAAAAGEVYPPLLTQEPDYGQQLDDNLEALYQWCISQDMPLLAHCSYSQYPSAAAGLRAAPGGWQSVLERHPSLRLNIGHCGGLWSVPASASKRPPRPTLDAERDQHPEQCRVFACLCRFCRLLDDDRARRRQQSGIRCDDVPGQRLA